ncbi:MAG: hypothetical protein RRC07_00105 [Anaerolineae bacterium]|nr:hypothetical protein [Anaerolineae bacterium]
MPPAGELDATPDPLALLDDELERVWSDIRHTYDVAGPLPELAVLFAGADLRDAGAAAEAVLVNMLTEVMERVSRFSPWYTRPASAYGLERVRDSATGRVCWRLRAEVKQHCQPLVSRLGRAISVSRSLLQVFILVDDFLETTPGEDDEAVLCCCDCSPPRYIWLPRCVVQQAGAVCDRCRTAFCAVEGR